MPVLTLRSVPWTAAAFAFSFLALPRAGFGLSFGSPVALQSVETGKCLEVAATAARGSAPTAAACGGESAPQLFWLWGSTSGFHIQSASSGRCLDVGLAEWRFNPYLYDCTWGQPQKFRWWRGIVGVLESVERPNECFDFGLRAWNVASPYVYSCWGGAPQRFTVTPYPVRLTGQRGKGEAPLNDTDPYGTADPALALPGGDLGVPVRHGNRTYFLFGDTELSRTQIVNAGCLDRYASETYEPPGVRPESVYLRNAVAYVDAESSPAVRFDGWLTNDCGFMREILQNTAGWSDPKLPPRNIPTSAVSIEDRLYVWYATPFGNGDALLAYADGDIATNQATFVTKAGYAFAKTSNFGMVAAAVSGDGHLYLLGSPWFRSGGVKLARVPANRASVEDLSAYRYYRRRSDGRISWVRSEGDATFLIDPKEKVGEGSLFWHPHERKWFFTYGSYAKDPNRGDLLYRWAPEPWGPWSAPSVLLAAQERPQGSFYAPYALLQWQPPNWLKYIFTEWFSYDLYLGDQPLR